MLTTENVRTSKICSPREILKNHNSRCSRIEHLELFVNYS